MDRRPRDLDSFVAAHRTTIAVVFPLAGAVLLAASDAGVLPPALAYSPLALLAGTLVMRLPLIAGLKPVVDRRAAAAVVALAGYAYAVEYVGVTTGVPYGEFHYAVSLGPMVAGVPVGLPVFFLPLVANAYLLSLLVTPADAHPGVRVAVAVALVVLVDAILDPAAVAVGFWTYAAPGAYYGVPLSNYAGWLVSGVVSVLVLDAGFDPAAVRARLAACPFALDDLVSFTLLWGALNAYYGNWLPVLGAAVLASVLARTNRFDASLPRPSTTINRLRHRN